MFLVVGAHALAVHGIPRATGDLDVWIRADAENARRVWAALARFGAPLDSLTVGEQDLADPGIVLQLGLPPRRIYILTEISGVDFETAWKSRTVRSTSSIEIPFLGREDLVTNKRASGRPKDLADLVLLGDDR